ncbi:MAG: D-glycero-beta-D-manno-heptose 1,7-bisphosphate 7-phosphatase [Gammaproteobacteria bacterium]|nr:D-glycero-beta-D-manno-heptose 1,7-bisphosphate 7-phosphatase [Gammaproteobacteria bacterium]
MNDSGPPKSRKAVFLDRDGTINVEKNYLHRLADWEWIPGAVDAILRLNRAAYLVIVVTNQAGIARGMYGEEEVRRLHDQIDAMLAPLGARIDAYYYCPHHPDFGDRTSCSCRKPAPGMILQAQRDWDIDLSRSYIVGDKIADIEAGLAAGVTPILVATGYGARSRPTLAAGVRCVSDIGAAAELILGSDS